MELINASSVSMARISLSRLAAPLRWAAVGFASACIVSPVLPWNTDSHSVSVAAHANRTSELVAPQSSPAKAAEPEPYEPGGPGPDDKTEWMPGNR